MARFNLYDSGGNFLGSAESNDGYGGGGGPSCIEVVLKAIIFIAILIGSNYILVKLGFWQLVWNDAMFIRYADNNIYNEECEYGLSWIVRYWTMHGFSGKWQVIQFFIGILSFVAPPIAVYIWKREDDWVGAYCIFATLLFSVLISALLALFNYGFSNFGIQIFNCWVTTLCNALMLLLVPVIVIVIPWIIKKAIIPY